jgi:hypothetical protein
MNNKQEIRVSVRDLMVGDITKGSGATITHRPYPSVRLSSKKLWVEGVWSNGQAFINPWNASTMVTVLRDV